MESFYFSYSYKRNEKYFEMHVKVSNSSEFKQKPPNDIFHLCLTQKLLSGWSLHWSWEDKTFRDVLGEGNGRALNILNLLAKNAIALCLPAYWHAGCAVLVQDSNCFADFRLPWL